MRVAKRNAVLFFYTLALSMKEENGEATYWIRILLIGFNFKQNVLIPYLTYCKLMCIYE